MRAFTADACSQHNLRCREPRIVPRNRPARRVTAAFTATTRLSTASEPVQRAADAQASLVQYVCLDHRRADIGLAQQLLRSERSFPQNGARTAPFPRGACGGAKARVLQYQADSGRGAGHSRRKSYERAVAATRDKSRDVRPDLQRLRPGHRIDDTSRCGRLHCSRCVCVRTVHAAHRAICSARESISRREWPAFAQSGSAGAAFDSSEYSVAQARTARGSL
jgi:hypothetical protein